MITILLSKVILVVAIGEGILAFIDPSWSLPLNTALLIVLSGVNLYRARRENKIHNHVEHISEKVDALPDPVPGGKRCTDPD